MIATAQIQGAHVAGVALATAENFADVLQLCAGCAAVGVDMPLALPVDGVRESDQLVKDFLGPAGRSLFWTPTRAAIDQHTHAEAVQVNKALGGKGPSAQGWGLAARIREVRAALAPTPDPRIFEAHPESSFAALHRARHGNDASPLGSKKSAAGVAHRLQLLAEWGVTGEIASVIDPIATLGAGPLIDDALDAIAAAWSAARVVAGEATWFGPRVIDDEGYVAAVAV